jgi:capsular exopolysaccharide synthesis family protein
MSGGPWALKRAETVHNILHTVDGAASSQPASHLPGSDDLNSLLADCHQASWKPDSARMIFFAGGETSPGTEELRALRSRLYLVRESQPMKSLLISSALRGEGKSFIAANLAHVLALQQDCRVLLIDGDLRCPRLHAMLGTSATPGLSEYLLDEVEDFVTVQRGRPENLFFIPAGNSVPGPTELLANGYLATLLKRLAPVFDWIIVDSPAAVPVSDASLLGAVCDSVLLVVRSGSTPYDVARMARERFRENQLLGVVLNSVQNGISVHSHRY